MKVLKAFGPQDLRIVDAPVPEPGPGYVRVKIRASGICGSDKGLWYVKEKSDFVAGHEAAGEVDKVGGNVASLAPGDRVMVNNVVGCGTCPACRSGAFAQCPAWNGSKDVNNGFGEYLVAPERNCLRIPQGLDYIDGALIMDNWGTPYGGLKRARFTRGMDVLVNGCGPIGQASVALAAALGAYVIAVDPIECRRAHALRNGARRAFAPDELPDAVKDATDGLGVDIAMECSGKGAAYDACLQSLRIGGSLITIGEGAEYVLNPSRYIIRRSLSIIGTWYSNLPDAGEVARLALSGQINARSFLTRTITLDEAPDLFGAIVNCEDGIIKCVIVFD